MKLCHCCKGFIASRYAHDEKGTLVPLCRTCWMKLQPYMDRQQEHERRKADAVAAIERDLLETMWVLDGSWVKEGQVMR